MTLGAFDKATNRRVNMYFLKNCFVAATNLIAYFYHRLASDLVYYKSYFIIL